MSNTSRNNSSTSLMGFSVHQPSIGSPLQFFPAMGSKQLDEMIDAYVLGDAPITDKRAAVSMEFFEHSMATGELFKFFMVYPSLGSATESPSGSMLDSGYGSSFTSPVMSESQWAQSSSAPLPSSESMPGKTSTKRMALSNDFSHLPGMKIITKDGKDVTNMTSRGCKTKEQRDHAHLMRIIKACDSCRRKKVRCDPSHKRSTGSSTAKISKKTKKTAAVATPSSAPPPQQTLEPLGSFLHTPSFDISDEAPSLSFDSAVSEVLVDLPMDWNQFIQFDEEPTEPIPTDYDFFHDPQGFLSPTSYASVSPSQQITSAQTHGVDSMVSDTLGGEARLPLPPYLIPGGEASNNYADFNLYSPGSSTSLEDDPSLSKEVAATPLPGYFEHSHHQRLVDCGGQETAIHENQNFDTQFAPANIQCRTSPLGLEQGLPQACLDTLPYPEGAPPRYRSRQQLEQCPEWHVSTSPDGLSLASTVESYKSWPQPRNISSPTEVDLRRTGLDSFMTPLDATSLGQGYLPKPITRSIATDQQLLSGAGTSSTTSSALVAPSSMTTDQSSRSQSPQNHNRHAQSKPVRSVSLMLRSPALESYEAGVAWPSLVSSSLPTQPTRFPRNIPLKAISSLMPELGIEDAHEGNNSADNSSAGLTTQDTTMPGANTQSGPPDGSVPSASLSGPNNGVLRSSILVSPLAMTALHALTFLFIICTVCQWRIFSNSAEQFQITPVLAGFLPVALASTKLRQRPIQHADTQDLSVRSRSFLKRLPFTVTGSIKLGYFQLSGSFSKSHCNFEKKYSLQVSNGFQGMRRLQHITSIAW
ncbi:uncharacterized protein GGS22DRAFT_159767 [Annulohypoxylon maeteangense]|uniref:uncharacterized protein n=1 Tax=Annulohypoxylon maeteangense TaxID=1927788 RepID=UPI002008777F|nr:uncharacterized protein GGS22DRAFT_159767 [Annulohypoxylon maeteangense]KAI0886065.1 hypothetical protein GGS22DRAFT_159767 [Annulohypoxylon maeteangense]